MAYFVTLTDVGMCISGQMSFYVRCSWINRYRLRIFFSQYWPRDYNLRKRFFEASSYARAFARMNYEVADGKLVSDYRVACLRKKKHGTQLRDENSFVQSRGRKSEPKNMKRRKLMGSKTIFTKEWKIVIFALCRWVGSVLSADLIPGRCVSDSSTELRCGVDHKKELSMWLRKWGGQGQMLLQGKCNRMCTIYSHLLNV